MTVYECVLEQIEIMLSAECVECGLAFRDCACHWGPVLCNGVSEPAIGWEESDESLHQILTALYRIQILLGVDNRNESLKRGKSVLGPVPPRFR